MAAQSNFIQEAVDQQITSLGQECLPSNLTSFVSRTSYHLCIQARPTRPRGNCLHQADNVRNLIGAVEGLGLFAITFNIVFEENVIQVDEELDEEKICIFFVDLFFK